MTPAPSAAVRPADAAAMAACPNDPLVVIAALRRSLFKAMRQRANGSWHLRTCLGSQVTATPMACSDDCLTAQIRLKWAECWAERPRHEQGELWEQSA